MSVSEHVKHQLSHIPGRGSDEGKEGASRAGLV